MTITAQDVKSLREKTGCGMMDCKRALTQANGDANSAIDILRKKGLAASAKKSGRLAAQGVAMAILNNDETEGVCIEVNSETDFVAMNTQFLEFVKTCANTILEKNPKDVIELLALKAFSSKLTVDELLKEKILVIGENIKIRRFLCFEGIVSGYTHSNGKIAALVKFVVLKDVAQSSKFKSFAKDIAMHIAAASPLYLSKDDVPASVIEHEKEILAEQISKEGKPEFIVQKIVSGRIEKFYKEFCLLNQCFVKNPDFSIKSYTEKISKELVDNIKIESFIRYQRGEGI